MERIETIEKIENVLETAKKNFNAWNEALQTKDPKKVAELYTNDSTFLPTMSGEFKSGQHGAEEYFEHFLLKNPFGKVVEEKAQVLDPECYIHSGLYNFEVGPSDKREIAEARFTYVWKKDKDGNWKIINHHSSVKTSSH